MVQLFKLHQDPIYANNKQCLGLVSNIHNCPGLFAIKPPFKVKMPRSR